VEKTSIIPTIACSPLFSHKESEYHMHVDKRAHILCMHAFLSPPHVLFDSGIVVNAILSLSLERFL